MSPQEGQTSFKEVIRDDEYALLAHCVQLGGDVGEAYQKAYEKWPDKEVLMEDLGWFLNLAGSNGTFTEKLYRGALKGQEKQLGPDHPDTLGSVNNLGNLLSDKGDYEGAQKLYRRALEGSERVLGPDHPDTLSSVSNLGVLVSDKGDYEGAEKLDRRALEGSERVLGPDHPDTLMSVNNLGNCLNEQNRRPELVNLLRSYASHFADEDTLAYNIACYECLDGNLDEAKRVITKHLEAHPENKEHALKDEDFAAIRDWIRKL